MAKHTKAKKLTAAEQTQMNIVPVEDGVFLQHHQPKASSEILHIHPSIEVNFLLDCDMTYSFSGVDVPIRRGRLAVFWGAHPHSVTSVKDKGMITNAYVSLSEFLLWPMPKTFVSALLAGAVLASRDELPGDREMALRWAREIDKREAPWRRLHALELQARLFRLTTEGWDVLLESSRQVTNETIGGHAISQFECMLRFVALHFADRISIRDVAKAGGVTTNHAIALFRKMMGRTIKQHITDMRMFYAKMLLAETDAKILTVAMDCGFGSLSAFYEAFQNHVGISPAAFRKHGWKGNRLDQIDMTTPSQPGANRGDYRL